MTTKKHLVCPKCGAAVVVTAGSSYTSSGPKQVCLANCGWSAPLPDWHQAAERAKKAVPNPYPKPKFETKGEVS